MIRRPLLIACGAIAAANVAFQVVGCNDIGDAPPVVDKEAGPPPDAGTPLCQGELPVMQVVDQNGQLQPGDWSCYSQDFDGSTIAPLDDGGDGSLLDVDLDALVDAPPGDGSTTDGAPPGDAGDGGTTTDAGATCTFHLSDFVSNQPTPNAQVGLYYNNVVGAQPDFLGLTDSKGNFDFPVPNTDVMAYGALQIPDAGASTQIVPVYQFDTATCKPGATYPGNTLTKSGYDLLSAGILGSAKVNPAKMSVVIGVRDCRYRDVVGGVVQLVDDATGQVITNDAAHADFRGAYFNSSGFPDPACTHTTAVFNQQYALYAALNVPMNTTVTAKVFGRTSELDSKTDPPLLGTRQVPQIPGAVVIIRPYKIIKQ